MKVEELDNDVKDVIHEHILTCNEYSRLYVDIKKTEIPAIDNNSNNTHIAPLKNLRRLYIGLLIFLVIC